MKEYISADLVQKAQTGDKHALWDLILRSDDIIRNTVFAFSLPPDEAEDLLQDIRLKVMKKLPKLENPPAYVTWLKQLAHNHCVNFLRKKRPYLLKEMPEEEGEDERPSILETSSLTTTSYGEFKKFEASLEYKERIEKTVGAIGMEAFGLLEKHYVQDWTLEELVDLAQGARRKTFFGERVSIASGQWVLEEANQNWSVADYEDARSKLSIILADFKPDDKYREKRVLLASALSRLGDINQVQGQIYGPDKSLEYYERAMALWNNLRDKKMAFYTAHMMALSNNVGGDYRKALKLLEEAKSGFKAKDALDRRWLGDLDRDMASIYIALNDIDSAEYQVNKALAQLEMAEHQESYLAALRVRGQIAIRRKRFERALEDLEASVREWPLSRALHHVQTKITKVRLFMTMHEDINKILKLAQEAENDCKKYGYYQQLDHLHKLLASYAVTHPF